MNAGAGENRATAGHRLSALRTEIGKRQAELFDPATQKWTPLANAQDVRTYHNSAALLPDGRVLVSGNTLTVKAPPSAAVAPPGPYMPFIKHADDKGLVPSKSAQLFLGIAGLERRAAAMRNGQGRHPARRSANRHSAHVRNHAPRPVHG